MTAYCGIDWAEGHHDIALVDGQGKLIEKQRVAESPEGLADLNTMLAEAGDSSESPIPVAIETPRGLLVAALRETGRPIYPINPLAVARYRERASVSGSKSDHVDAMTLANILRTDAHLHRMLPQDSPLARSISVLARGYQDAVWRRTKLVQELRARLREYYPGFFGRVRYHFWGHVVDAAGQQRRPRGVGYSADPTRGDDGIEDADRDSVAAWGPATPHHQPNGKPVCRAAGTTAASRPDRGASDAGRSAQSAAPVEHGV